MSQTDSGNAKTVEMLQKAYRMELETVINYLSNSVHLDGMRAEEVKRSLGSDITAELGHATQIAHRIKQLRGRIPGSLELKFDQEGMRPPQTTTDVNAIVEGVIAAENAAISHYRAIIEHCESAGDPVTVDLATQLLADEEEHRSQFEGFNAEIKLGA